MPKLKLRSIKFGEPGKYHYITFKHGNHESEINENWIDIYVEVRIPASTESKQIEEIALNKACAFIKQFAATL
ncbi:hypothetical protein MUP95_06375 [bacterium]|nr:hypothetical protein [bacterium]